MKISVTDFSAPVGASVLKLCVHLQVGKVYCVNGNKDANPQSSFYLLFSIFHFFLLSLLYNMYGLFFCQRFLSNYLVRILKFGTKFDSDKLYCVTKKNSHILLISPFICSFFFLSNENFCRRFLGSYWSQCFQILCTPSGRLSVLCK